MNQPMQQPMNELNQNQKKTSAFRVFLCGWFGLILGLWMVALLVYQYLLPIEISAISIPILTILGCVVGYFWKVKPKFKKTTTFQALIISIGVVLMSGLTFWGLILDLYPYLFLCYCPVNRRTTARDLLLKPLYFYRRNQLKKRLGII